MIVLEYLHLELESRVLAGQVECCLSTVHIQTDAHLEHALKVCRDRCLLVECRTDRERCNLLKVRHTCNGLRMPDRLRCLGTDELGRVDLGEGTVEQERSKRLRKR